MTTSSKVTTASARTLYAHWTGNTYGVTLDRQGGAGGTASVTATLEETADFVRVFVLDPTGYSPLMRCDDYSLN